MRRKADPPRTVHLNARYDQPDWRMVGLNEAVELTEEWQQFSYTFRAEEPLPEHSRLSFNNTNSVGDVSVRLAALLDAVKQVYASTFRQRAKAYVERRMGEGKSWREALRCLKRHLANVVLRTMLADAEASVMAGT